MEANLIQTEWWSSVQQLHFARRKSRVELSLCPLPSAAPSPLQHRWAPVGLLKVSVLLWQQCGKKSRWEKHFSLFFFFYPTNVTGLEIHLPWKVPITWWQKVRTDSMPLTEIILLFNLSITEKLLSVPVNPSFRIFHPEDTDLPYCSRPQRSSSPGLLAPSTRDSGWQDSY